MTSGFGLFNKTTYSAVNRSSLEANSVGELNLESVTSVDQLNALMETLGNKMEVELAQSREVYERKRAPILDAIERKKTRRSSAKD